MRYVDVGRDALLAEVGSPAEALALYAAARAARIDATDIVPAARTVLFDGAADPPRLRDWLDGLRLDGLRLDALRLDGRSAREEERLVEVPTVYDGADLASVAELWKMSPAEVVATHTGTDFIVAFCGFAPGFAYCTGLPERFDVPRLTTPRPRVPAGSVAVAGEFTGVYPTASPGGWRLLGRTLLTLWNPSAPEPATLAPGTRVRFVEVRR